jgi:hypothetical protein
LNPPRGLGASTYNEPNGHITHDAAQHHNRAAQRSAEQSRAEQSRAEQSRAEQSRAEQSRAEQSRAEQSREQRAEHSAVSLLVDTDQRKGSVLPDSGQ